MEFKTVLKSGVEWVNVSGKPIRGFDWQFRHDGDAFYVCYAGETEDDSDEYAHVEPSSPEEQALLPDPDDYEACAEFGYGLATEDIETKAEEKSAQ